MNPPQRHVCPHCGNTFAWQGRTWLISDPQGRLNYSRGMTDQPEPEPKIERCPACGATLKPQAKVEETE